MKDLLLVGGMGSGKDTLITALEKAYPEINHVSMAPLAGGIPLHLSRTSHPDLLKLPREECIIEILKNQDLVLPKYERDEYDDIGARLLEKYGINFHGDLYLAVREPDVPNIYNHVAKLLNLRYIQESVDAFTLGLDCEEDTQAERRFKNRKPMDPETIEDMKLQVQRTNAYFQTDWMLKECDVVVNTDMLRSNDPSIVQLVLSHIQ